MGRKTRTRQAAKGTTAIQAAAPQRAASTAWRWLIPVVLVLAALGAYANSTGGPFIFDDLGAIRDNPHIRQLWPLAAAVSAPAGTTVTGRPVVALSLAANYAIGGLDVQGYHVFNLAVHLLAALLLYGVVRRSLEALRTRGLAGPLASVDPAWPAAIVALLWELHPLATEAVDYTVQRSELLASLFLLLTLYCFARSVSAVRRWPWSLAAVAACAAGMGCKETMAGAPVLVFVYDATVLSASWREPLKARGPAYAGLAATWAILAALVATGARAQTVGFSFEGLTAWRYALTQCGVIVHYLRLAVWPAPLALDYADWPVAQGLVDALPAGLVVLALVGTTAWALKRAPAIGFLGASVFIILAPSSSVIPIVTEVAAERRMYLPLAAVVTLVVVSGAWLVRRLPDRFSRTAVSWALVGGLAIVLGALTHQRNEAFATEVGIWDEAVVARPGNARAHNNLGMALVRAGQGDEALPHFRRALELAPEYPDALNNLGGLLYRKGQPAETIRLCRQALAASPGMTDARYNLALALHRTGDLDAAEREYREVLRQAPGHVATHNNLGLLLAGRGRFREAADQLTEALRLDPDNATIRQSLERVTAEINRR